MAYLLLDHVIDFPALTSQHVGNFNVLGRELSVNDGNLLRLPLSHDRRLFEMLC